jgi:hypothetical protein
MGTREDLEEGVGDGAVADRDDVDREREGDTEPAPPDASAEDQLRGHGPDVPSVR